MLKWLLIMIPLLPSCGVMESYMLLSDDCLIEEVIECIIEDQTSYDIDLSPMSPE